MSTTTGNKYVLF